MITIFRRLRRTFLSNGNTGKYIKYAIGEIILVVIGILIALQINVWNEGRKDVEKEQLILKQLQEEYEANLQELQEKMAMRTSIINSSKKLLKYIDQPQPNAIYDSILNHLRWVLLDPTFDPIYNDLISTGNIRLITDQRLSRLLSNWSSDIVVLQETEDIWQDHTKELVAPFIIKTGIARDVVKALWQNGEDQIWLLDGPQNNYLEVGSSIHPPATAEFLNAKDLEGILTIAISLNHTANIQSVALRNRILEILDLLKKEITQP